MTRLEDVHAIEQLQRTYARLNDEARWHDVAELFTEDAAFTRPSDPGRPLLGRAAILQSLLARPQGAPRQHLVANPEVELIDHEHARAHCHSILLMQQGDDAGTVMVGSFVDALTRTADGWRFASRTGSITFDPVPYTTRKAAPPGANAPTDPRSAATPGHSVPQPQS